MMSTWPLLNLPAKLVMSEATGWAPSCCTSLAWDLSQSSTAIFLPAAFSMELMLRSRTNT
jgi:hypothetical protein